MKLWDLRAHVYDWFRRPWPLNDILQRETRNIRALLNAVTLQPAAVVLDMGCGVGHSSGLVSARFLIALDRSPQMVRKTRQKTGVVAVVAKAEQVPIKAGAIDLFLAVGLTEYLKKPDRLFSQLAFAGKQNCYAVVTFSPPNLFTFLRIFLGTRIYPRRPDRIYSLCQKYGFAVLAEKHFFTQTAFLLQKQ